MAEKNSEKVNAEKAETQKPRCGIIMPISEIDGCSAEHWLQVKSILLNVIGDAGFTGDLVSNSLEVSFIHKTIVNNIYANNLIICDVSGKNPNVMFELGIRLTFDKPTIIIKDDITNYSFDTSPIEHLSYPRDLNYHQIISFTENLRDKIIDTYEKAENDTEYSPFLKHFGDFVTPKLNEKEVPINDFIISSLDDLRKEVSYLSSKVISGNTNTTRSGRAKIITAKTPIDGAIYRFKEINSESEFKKALDFLHLNFPVSFEVIQLSYKDREVEILFDEPVIFENFSNFTRRLKEAGFFPNISLKTNSK